jgi:hypothetical protein
VDRLSVIAQPFTKKKNSYYYPPGIRNCAFYPPNWQMGSDQKRIFLQGSLNEPLATGKVGVGISPFDHPCGLLPGSSGDSGSDLETMPVPSH